jgi:hypothetical protein
LQKASADQSVLALQLCRSAEIPCFHHLSRFAELTVALCLSFFLEMAVVVYCIIPNHNNEKRAKGNL